MSPEAQDNQPGPTFVVPFVWILVRIYGMEPPKFRKVLLDGCQF